MRNPTEEAIKKVMDETGMEYIQARNHLKQRYQLQEQFRVEHARRVSECLSNP